MKGTGILPNRKKKKERFPDMRKTIPTDKIQLIKDEIERRIKECDRKSKKTFSSSTHAIYVTHYSYKINELTELLTFINKLK
jgi:hypothetical protein